VRDSFVANNVSGLKACEQKQRISMLWDISLQVIFDVGKIPQMLLHLKIDMQAY